MKTNIIVIGGGIVGATAAFYLSKEPRYQLTLIDEGIGTATRAAAGIISPWLSQRRNKDWYRLTAAGAAFYPRFIQDLPAQAESPYQQTGTLVFKNKESLLTKLETLAHQRQVTDPMIGEIQTYHPDDLHELIPPLTTDQGAVYATGGARVDGGLLLNQLYQEITAQGGTILREKAQVIDPHTVLVSGKELHADFLLLTVGAWLPELLEPLRLQVDIRPQKGQLLEVNTSYETDDWPGCMLHGEIDILPFQNGRLVIGATHEDDQGYDLSIDTEQVKKMKKTAQEVLPSLAELPIARTRVGTRAYSSTFSPFYGPLDPYPHLFVASGLGSSGLTSGPFIGWQLAQHILGKATGFDARSYSPTPYIQFKN